MLEIYHDDALDRIPGDGCPLHNPMIEHISFAALQQAVDELADETGVPLAVVGFAPVGGAVVDVHFNVLLTFSDPADAYFQMHNLKARLVALRS